MRKRFAVMIVALLLGVYLLALILASTVGAERMNMERAASETLRRKERSPPHR